jgi:hypothetical protein
MLSGRNSGVMFNNIGRKHEIFQTSAVSGSYSGFVGGDYFMFDSKCMKNDG